MSKTKISSRKDFFEEIIDKIDTYYWQPLYDYLIGNPDLIKSFPGLLLESNHVVLYVGKTHLGIEYYGSEKVDSLTREFRTNISIHHVPLTDQDNLLEYVIGFEYYDHKNMQFPVVNYNEDLIVMAGNSYEKLVNLHWNFDAQEAFIFFNPSQMVLEEGKVTRIVNGRFFKTTNEDNLKIRQIKWIDFIPIEEIHHKNLIGLKIKISILSKMIENDAHFVYPLPSFDKFKYEKLIKLNRFVELISKNETTETDITKFLSNSENLFILKMAFFSNNIYPEVLCEWQSDSKKSIKPDFLIERSNGLTDIVEFKLPKLKSKTVVGSENRETISAELNKYISQTRVYKTYFEDPKNRKWVEEKYELKVRYPKRILVLGRRWNFKNKLWEEIINEFQQIRILTYDELIEGVKSLLYN